MLKLPRRHTGRVIGRGGSTVEIERGGDLLSSPVLLEAWAEGEIGGKDGEASLAEITC